LPRESMISRARISAMLVAGIGVILVLKAKQETRPCERRVRAALRAARTRLSHRNKQTRERPGRRPDRSRVCAESARRRRAAKSGTQRPPFCGGRCARA